MKNITMLHENRLIYLGTTNFREFIYQSHLHNTLALSGVKKKP